MLPYFSAIFLAALTFYDPAIGSPARAPDSICLGKEVDPIKTLHGIYGVFSKPFELPSCQQDDSWNPQFINLSHWIGNAYGLKRAPIIVWEEEELKYVPFTLESSEILLVLKDHRLTPEKLAKVAAVLSVKGIRVHLVWLGDGIPPISLQEFISGTNGMVLPKHSEDISFVDSMQAPRI